MSYSMVLENDLVLSGLTDKIILSSNTNYIKKIFKTMNDRYVTIYDSNSPGSMICNEDFSDNDIKMVHKFDVNLINKLPIL